ncbi:FadR/GntR family transcriptional regulator [Paraburkholderia xenovorans]|uniref:FadR/GntR family transcriptional regulator n=1 Tax=Paraburkholderia xenovorans TaxID=36873 RepID=UPI0038BBA61A
MLELERPDSLVQRVVTALRAEIDAGHFPAESRLPTEQQLSERLNVSRSVVREAIAQLKSDGVLVARRGAGSFISQTPSGTVFRLPGGGNQKLDLAQLFEMRLWIETQAAMTAARRRTPEDLKRMSDAIREMEKKRLDFDAASAADVAFHRAIAAATKNEYFIAFHDFLRGQLVAVRRAQWANTASHAGDYARQEHGELYEAIERGDHRGAAESAERHLRAAAKRQKIELPPSD